MSPAGTRAAGGADEAEAVRTHYASRRFSMRENEAGPELRFGALDGIVFEDGLDEGTAANLVLWLNRMLESAKSATLAARPAPPDDGALAETVHRVLAPRFCRLIAIARRQREWSRLQALDIITLGQRAASAEAALAEARAIIAPFARYAEQHRYLDGAEGEIGEFYGPAFRVSISYAALRAARDFAPDAGRRPGAPSGGDAAEGGGDAGR